MTPLSGLPSNDPLADLGRVHLIGVGGAGMSALTRLLCSRGVPVSGSEIRESRILAPLRALGADIQLRQTQDSLPDVDTVVVSTAIKESNPEWVSARERGIRVMHRAEVLEYSMRSKVAVVVAGTHGKTTTTSMLAVALQHAGADPSFYIGAQLNETGSNAHAGSGRIFLAESDESDGSFLVLRPDLAIVTNVEADHLDHWGDEESVHAAFERFAVALVSRGRLVACADDTGAVRLAAYARAQGVEVFTYGESEQADLRIHNVALTAAGATFVAEVQGGLSGADRSDRHSQPVALQVLGRHNVLNSGGALAGGVALGFDIGPLADGLALYSGVRRRFEFKGEADGVRVYDDYAHHHSEIAASLATAHDIAGQGRVVVAFQPLRYTRTLRFHRELGHALGQADDVVVLEVYGSNEEPIPGATGALVADSVPLASEHVHFEPSFSAVPAWLLARAKPGDVIVTLGDGIVTTLGPEVVDMLNERQRAAL